MTFINTGYTSLINLLSAITHTNTDYISIIHFLLVITLTRTSLERDLPSLAKIYASKATYSSWNHNFILQLANLYKDILNN